MSTDHAAEASATAGDIRKAGQARRRRLRRRRLVALGTLALIVVVIAAAGVSLGWSKFVDATTTTLSPGQVLQNKEDKAVAAAIKRLGVALPARPTAAIPALPGGGGGERLGAHQVFGFVPYWDLASASSIPVQDFTTIAYFALGIAPDGSLVQSGNAWYDLGDSSFNHLMRAAHAAGDRVLLTVSSSDQPTLDAISSCPAACAAKLAPQLESLVRQFHFDGVDLDLEGLAAGDRQGFADFAGTVADDLHAAVPGTQMVLDTYPQSADDPGDFYDVAALAPHFDQIFIMGYDMEDQSVPSANAPLTGAAISDVAALQAYTAIVPPSKLIFGDPFYGVDWTENGPSGDPGTLSAPISLTYATISAGHHVPLWDPTTETVWFQYTYAGKAHIVWFDDPLSLALKAALASQYHLAGDGIWALGMQGAAPEMIQALVGDGPVVKLPATG